MSVLEKNFDMTRSRSIFKKIVLALLAIVFGLMVIISTLLWWVVVHPDDAWRFAKQHFLPADLEVSWQEIHFKPEKVSWLHWNIDWSIHDLKIHKGQPRFSAVIDEAALVFSFSVYKPATRADFAKVVLHASQPIIYQGEPSPAGPPAAQSIYQQMRQMIHYIELGNASFSMRNLDVQLKDLEYITTGEKPDKLVASVDIQKSESATSTAVVNFNLGVHSSTIKQAGISGWLDATKLGQAEDFAQGKILFDGFNAHGETDFSLIFSDEVLRAKLQGPWRYQSGKLKTEFNPQISVTLNPEQAELRLVSAVSGLPPPVVKLDRIDGRVVIPLQEDAAWSSEPAKYNFTSPVKLFFIDEDMRRPFEQSCQCRVPEKLLVGLKGQVWLDQLLDPKSSKIERQISETRLSVEGVKNKLISVDLAATLNVARRQEQWIFKPKLDSEFHILSFQGLRKFLDAQNVLIPAPFDVLDGTIDFVARGEVPFDKNVSHIPMEIKTHLNSSNQVVELSSQIKLDVASTLKNIDIYFKLIIDEFQIQLPPLNPIAGMPKFTRDSRLRMTPKHVKPVAVAKKPKIKVNLFFEAVTKHPGSIRLLSKYAKPNVPVTVDVKRAPDGILTGSIQLEPFKIQYLRRTVKVEQMRVLLDGKDNADLPVDGRFVVDQTEYRVFIDVSGTLNKPLLRFSSEPYLPKNDIISVLLYDRKSSDSSDAETAGSFESAIADRAIGLFGLWAFASTPIKSFSYNPVTKVYSATVQLTDDVTAGIGTNWEEAAHLEVRKRVSRQWVLTASWTPSSASYGDAPKLVLQWEKRF